MQKVSSKSKLKSYLSKYKSSNFSIGLVPTLGKLHEGHATLIRKSAKENDITVVSIFVNRPQFRKKGFLEYPRDIEADYKFAEKLGVNYLFVPDEKEIYTDRFDSKIVVNKLSSKLDGKAIKWHYIAVSTIVGKLFNIVRPDRAYFGKKDPHQLSIIKRMNQDLDFDIEIVEVATKRKRSGIPFSSRNSLLTAGGIKEAVNLYKSILKIEEMIKNGEKDRSKLRSTFIDMIGKNYPTKVEFIEIVDNITLDEKIFSGESLIYAAVKVDDIRITDNKVVKSKHA